MKHYRYILQLLCLLIATSMSAEESEQSLVVILKSGTMITLPVSEQPKITFDGTVMRVGDGDYQIENVRKWLVGNVEEIAAGLQVLPNGGKRIRYQDGVLTVGTTGDVRVWNAAGVEMPVTTRNGQVDMRQWPQGIYLVKAGTETLKLRKR